MTDRQRRTSGTCSNGSHDTSGDDELKTGHKTSNYMVGIRYIMNELLFDLLKDKIMTALNMCTRGR